MLSRLLCGVAGVVIGGVTSFVATTMVQDNKKMTINRIVVSHIAGEPTEISEAKHRALKSILFGELEDKMFSRISPDKMIALNKQLIDQSIESLIRAGVIDPNGLIIRL